MGKISTTFDAERRRKAIREALSAAEMTPTDAARAAGWPNANRLYNFLNGRASSLSAATLEDLSRVIGGATVSNLSGMESTDDIAPPVRQITVRSAVQAGMMRPTFDIPSAQQSQVPLPLGPGAHAAGAYGVIVRSPGAENLYPANSILACLPVTAWDRPIRSGQHLIVQRLEGDRVEVTVREIDIQANEAWLWFRSTHPAYQAPVRMPFVPGQALQPWHDGTSRWSIVAVVIGAWTPGP